ncbi:leucine-rich repeat and guanylate kinase domain-containing protein isoform X1 [Pantherophis guttatus]|uniref:Leucine-rich repeat and guanylate kinase domain-containing protein isoform X1 n=1 Tax=Pantherophis guttatus TaxID=94885 RepID=A0ABM3Z3T9_PANGU|nr:leucine-rich repeat and guanylate kinase domain-containing protein isoform X1 [Pantherophis guttatus]
MSRPPPPRSPSPLSTPSSQSWRDLSHASLEDRMALTRSWVAAPSVTFSLLRAGQDERLSRGQEEELTESEEEEEEEEESTESEPEPELMEEVLFDGMLTEATIAEALHTLGHSASGTERVYLHLSLSDRLLSDVHILYKYIHLEKLNLSYNKISDLSCISYMPYLLELDVSHNVLTTYFDFRPPKNLQVANFSYNDISKMKDLSDYQSLKKLILDNNSITEIQGLENCHSLTYLSLANNKIKAITGLKHLPIKTLCLKSNQIEKAVGLEKLEVLQVLDLSGNQISSLEGLEDHNLLQDINLEDNQVSELSELEYIESLPLLRVFSLLKNPVQDQEDYWLLVIFMLLRLIKLDHKKISAEEKVAAVNKYDPPPKVVAAQDHMTHIMYSMMQPQHIFNSTLPSLDAPYPMLVLTGPLACWKRELCHRLCRKFNNYFRYSPCHTTRSPYFGEENRLDYYYVSQEEFDKMVNTGKFIVTFKYSGFYYGLSREIIESIAREGLATCVHLDIEGVRSLKNSYFVPRYILLIPVNKEKYGGHLRRMGLFSRPEIEEALRRVDMYTRVNQDFPGFFDAVINVDDYDEAFSKLSGLLEEFLGLVQPSESKATVPAADGKHLSAPSKESTAALKVSNVRGTDGVAPSPTPNEFLDSSAKNYSAKISAQLSAQKTLVEEASLQRRQRLAKQGLMGKTISSYSQLFERDALRVSGLTSMHRQFLEPPSFTSMGSFRRGTSTSTSILPTTPDPSKESGQPAKKSLTDSGAPLSPSTSASRTSRSVPTPVAEGADEKSRQEADRPADSKEKKTPKHKTPSPHVPPMVTVRPGSNTKPVLPPIPSGRKKPKAAPADSYASVVWLKP